MKTRIIKIVLTEELERYSYTISVDKYDACSGDGFSSALHAYNCAIRQLEFNADSFPLDIPDNLIYVEDNPAKDATLEKRGKP